MAEMMEKALQSGMDLLVEVGRYALPALALLIILRCLFSLRRNRPRVVTLGILVNGANGDECPLNHWETSIGRNKTCDIFLAYNTISRFHAVLSRRRQGFVVFDTYSKTGVYVNGKKIERKSPVYDGDSIMMGNVVLFLRAPACPPPADRRGTPVSRRDEPVGAPLFDAVEQPEPFEALPAPPAVPQVFEDIQSQRMPALCEEATGEVHDLTGRHMLIGRSTQAGITLPAPTVSARHAGLTQLEDGWVIEDLDSKAGTLVNGKLIHGPQTLFDGDTVNLGGVLLRFVEDYTS